MKYLSSFPNRNYIFLAMLRCRTAVIISGVASVPEWGGAHRNSHRHSRVRRCTSRKDCEGVNSWRVHLSIMFQSSYPPSSPKFLNGFAEKIPRLIPPSLNRKGARPLRPPPCGYYVNGDNWQLEIYPQSCINTTELHGWPPWAGAVLWNQLIIDGIERDWWSH